MRIRTSGGSITRIDKVFANNKIEKVSFGENVELIGNRGFKNNNITEVKLPDSLEEIDSQVFKNNKIESMEFGSNLTNLGDMALANNNLDSIEVPSSIERISRGAFRDNNIESIDLTNNTNITTIGREVFKNNDIKGHFEVPENISRVSCYAFKNNNIDEVTIQNSSIELHPYPSGPSHYEEDENSFAGNSVKIVHAGENLYDEAHPNFWNVEEYTMFGDYDDENHLFYHLYEEHKAGTYEFCTTNNEWQYKGE